MLRFVVIVAAFAALASPAAAETNPLQGVATHLKKLIAPPVEAAEGSKPLQIVVWNLRKAIGTVRVAICTQSTFLKADCPWEAVVPASNHVATVTIPALPPGVYAAQVFQDENDNHKVDRNVLGVPKEGVGFSNDAPIKLKAPSFKDAAFAHDAEDADPIRIKLRYWP